MLSLSVGRASIRLKTRAPVRMQKINNRGGGGTRNPRRAAGRAFYTSGHRARPAAHRAPCENRNARFHSTNKNNDSHYTHAMRRRESLLRLSCLGNQSRFGHFVACSRGATCCAKQNQRSLASWLVGWLAATSADEKIDPVKSWSGRGGCLPGFLGYTLTCFFS
jgi:hypothetical protein